MSGLKAGWGSGEGVEPTRKFTTKRRTKVHTYKNKNLVPLFCIHQLIPIFFASNVKQSPHLHLSQKNIGYLRSFCFASDVAAMTLL